MPVRVRLLLFVIAAAFVTVACEGPVVVVVDDTATPEPTPTAASVLDDGTEGQQLQDPTATAVPGVTAIASQITVPTLNPPDPAKETAIARETQTRVTATPAIPGRVTAVVPTTVRATTIARPTVATRPTATPLRRATPTATPRSPISIPTRLVPATIIPIKRTATPISVTRTDDNTIQGAVTAGGGQSEASNVTVIGAAGTFAGTSDASNATIDGGPLAGLISTVK